jgi:hypothetical protein
MSFKSLTDNQILALAIDEWLMGLDDEEWEKALLHIEKRKRQREKRKVEQSDSREYRSKARNQTLQSIHIKEP